MLLVFIILIVYISTVNRLPYAILNICDTPLARIALLLGVMYTVQSNVSMGILMALAYLHTYSIINDYNVSEGFLEGLMDNMAGIDPEDDQATAED